MLARRQFLCTATVAAWAPAAFAASPAAQQATAKVQEFLAAVIGKPAPERLRLAGAALDGVNALDSGSLLVEIAAMGVMVRGMPTETSIKQGLPKRSRQSLAYATQKLGDAAWTHALQGAWHLEVVRRSNVGALVYGASLNKGNESFAKALSMGEKDHGLNLSYAIALLSDDPDQTAGKALEVVKSSPDVQPGVYGAVVAQHSARLREL